jgi:hypothetical protein
MALGMPFLGTQILVSVLQSSEEILIYPERSDVTMLFDDAECIETLRVRAIMLSVNWWYSITIKATSSDAWKQLSFWFHDLRVPHPKIIDIRYQTF